MTKFIPAASLDHLVGPDEPRVTDNVGDENGREPAFHRESSLPGSLAAIDGGIYALAILSNVSLWLEADIRQVTLRGPLTAPKQTLAN